MLVPGTFLQEKSCRGVVQQWKECDSAVLMRLILLAKQPWKLPAMEQMSVQAYCKVNCIWPFFSVGLQVYFLLNDGKKVAFKSRIWTVFPSAYYLYCTAILLQWMALAFWWFFSVLGIREMLIFIETWQRMTSSKLSSQAALNCLYFVKKILYSSNLN